MKGEETPYHLPHLELWGRRWSTQSIIPYPKGSDRNQENPWKKDIDNMMLKNIGRRGIAAITSLANAKTRLDNFPAMWKVVNNANSLGKVAERILLLEERRSMEDLPE